MRDGEKLSFVRDIPAKNFFWGVGMASQPELSYFRREMTKITSFITIIDDIYDVYGTLQELELFTHVVHNWDIHAMHTFPSYMKICFLALYNSVNDAAFAILKHTGINIIPYLKKVWGDICESNLTDSWISIQYDSIRPQDFEYLQEYPCIIRLSSTIVRFAIDLAAYNITNSDVSSKSSSGEFDADITKSLKCYMNETGTSEQEAYEYVLTLICQTWKKMNEAVHNSEFSPGSTEIALNLARMARDMYQHGDGHPDDSHTSLPILSLLDHPIPITSTC
ncbi:terpene synthase 10-like [Neltuma alba]|uniref:terpene synthase 10-like n=1 Tax=Neltuma alba TaxID=207710 RepID=UPI0010A31343|nr:terpene synthase 10-like [Prosopis alba]